MIHNMRLILASQSPQRKKILEDMGYVFDVVASDIDERAIRRSDPAEQVIAIAQAKAEKVLGMAYKPAVILASDTLVVSADNVREKPENAQEALRFLEEISSGIPQVTYTAIAVINTETGARAHGVAKASVVFNPIPEAELRVFVESGETFGHAGGWAIQKEPFASRVREISGQRDAIVGLPKELTRRLLVEVGFSLQS